MVLKIKISDNNVNEKIYIIDILFREFLGLEYKIELGSYDYEIYFDNGKCLIIKDTFFNNYPKNLEYLKLENVPKKIDELDIFSACFFMLTRWEEHVNRSRNIHDRFPAYVSLAGKEGFLNRPIVNEYVEELKYKLFSFDNNFNFKFKEYTFKQYISCDVDEAFDCTVKNIKILFRVCLGDFIKRKSLILPFTRIRKYIFNKFGNYKYDDNYTFEWYMGVYEKVGLRASSYFIPNSKEKGNSCYSLKDIKIQKLLKYIYDIGHEIGVHGSYQTYKDSKLANKQKKYLDIILKKLNIKQKIIGNRQHYLRWDSSKTPSVLDNTGFIYDATGSYAYMLGFRYGVCYDFSMFDFINRKK